MSWSLAAIIIHPEDEDFRGRIDANYAMQDPLDATESVVSFWGSKSELVTIEFILDEGDNSNVGLSTLKTATKNGTTAALIGDPGALGNWKILSLEYRRKQALNKSALVWICAAELVSA